MVTIDSSEFRRSGKLQKDMEPLLNEYKVPNGKQRIYPQRLISENFTLAEMRLLGKWINGCDYAPFLSGLLSMRFGDFDTANIGLIVGAIQEGISEEILDITVGNKLKVLLNGE